MAHRQFTSCVRPIFYIDFLNPLGVVAGSAYLWFGALIAGIVAGLIYAFNVVAIPILIGLVLLVIAFLTWWLHGRLICLGGVRCAIGAVRSVGDPQPTSKGGDDDATLNVYLAPGPTNLKSDKEVYWNTLQGELLKEQSQVLQIGRGYVREGKNLKYVQSLHCEFEGSGIRNVLIWANVILALLVAALLVMTLVPPPVGPILGLILRILAAVLSVGALGIQFFGPLNPGDPTDVNPDLNKSVLVPGALVVVKGDWIYDSLHQGWNEIHAVHACQIISEVRLNEDGSWPADIGGGKGLDTPEKVKALVDEWCLAVDQADEAEEGGSRDNPEHDWVVHPYVDGCSTVIIT
jgi:hypothetical protein